MELGSDDLRELRALVAAEAPARADRLEHAGRELAGGDPGRRHEILAGLAHEAHALRGTAVTVRLVDLETLARGLEDALLAPPGAGEGPGPAVHTALARLVAHLHALADGRGA